VATAGVYNDLGSGSNVDLCIITKDGADMKRNYEFLQAKTYERLFPINFAETPSVVTKEKKLVSLEDVTILEGAPEAMDTST
jgi:20S proteasome subunit beta 2